jgi:hypothetical protein
VLITAQLPGPANFGIVQMAGFYFVDCPSVRPMTTPSESRKAY